MALIGQRCPPILCICPTGRLDASTRTTAGARRFARSHTFRTNGCQTAAVWELRIEERLICSEFAPEFVCNHIKTGQELPCLELHFGRGMELATAFVPPHPIGIAHDFAYAVIQEQRLNGAKERKYQLEAHSDLSQAGSSNTGWGEPRDWQQVGALQGFVDFGSGCVS